MTSVYCIKPIYEYYKKWVTYCYFLFWTDLTIYFINKKYKKVNKEIYQIGSLTIVVITNIDNIKLSSFKIELLVIKIIRYTKRSQLELKPIYIQRFEQIKNFLFNSHPDIHFQVSRFICRYLKEFPLDPC